jgi:hypothetical protein
MAKDETRITALVFMDIKFFFSERNHFLIKLEFSLYLVDAAFRVLAAPVPVPAVTPVKSGTWPCSQGWDDPGPAESMASKTAA